MPSIAASFVAAKRSFSRCFAWSCRHKFSYLRNFNRSWSSRQCLWRRLRAVWAISGSRHQPRSRRRSVSCDRVNVNKPKLRNFDRPLGLPDHLQWSFWRRNVLSLRNTMVRVRGNCCCRGTTVAIAQKEGTRDICRILMNHLGCLVVASTVFDVGSVSSLRKTMARVRDNCRCRQSWSMSPPSPFRNFAENPQFCMFISPSILRSRISHFALYQHPPPDGPARRTSTWHLQH